MREGTPSVTAQRVAAHRLLAERVESPFGDPAADRLLAEDVAGGISVDPDEPISRYLRARTAFFDRVVVGALQRQVSQVVLVGAGYDGRAFRYATPGCRWFEVDHPSTQDDKRHRLRRLGIDAAQITFVGADLRHPGLAATLLDAGFQPDAPAQVLCEGVTVYLDPPVVDHLLGELRALAAPGTRLALSSSTERTASGPEARARFAARVAQVGEPVRSAMTAGETHEALRRARWRKAELSERATRLGLVVATPAWVPATPPAPPSAGRLAAYMERTFHRAGDDGLPAHLRSAHEVEVAGLRRLDVGVHRVDLVDGRHWVARVFPASRPLEATEAEAGILRWLDAQGFPAERVATADPVSVHQGQPVLVTELVPGRAPSAGATAGAMGALLGRLHSLPPPAGLPAGGAWHHLTLGGPAEEVAAVLALLDDAAPAAPPERRPGYRALRDALAGPGQAVAEACRTLPQALVHPDFVPRNAIAGRAGDLHIVDWSGAGAGPRLWSLAFLLWATGQGRKGGASAAMAGYCAEVDLQPTELRHLAAAMAVRPLVLLAWSVATGRQDTALLADRMAAIEATVATITSEVTGSEVIGAGG